MTAPPFGAKSQIMQIIKKVPFFETIIIIIIINLALLVFGIIAQKVLPPQIPLFFGKPFGEEQLANSIFIIIPAAISLIITIINMFLIKIISDEFIQKTLVAGALLATVLSMITSIKIILLIGNL
ncbi:MAG: hypothetical protein UV74_C0013G0584 [Candidatus Woesebacteria bacterium GW2011_GWB1_43_14]|uniref:Uncharacterized protein n=1 Tax=Candidatus Woesebacteria bacterium GW2011_GWB1_43_14 TaxID=1618578 RepID=A0A0G1DIP0_9BACT|nr:MAG: hypothetical protein UV51_C0008G0006 [Candidatus Woesebacteria bacterium GW2011_GWC1_42_9]KKS97462.1 MAG: hypothetical protein UV74_C0013G0584 [Candidatus Woesebacteria bacterium GW2011_GWB1_43_14]